MALGFVVGSGPWQIRQFNTNSSATFLKGCLVELNGARDLVEYASTSSSVLGIALQNSAASAPPGKVLVAIPAPGCTAFCDLTAAVMPVSAVSAGQALGISKVGNYNSFATLTVGSVWSRIVTATGWYDSAASRIEVSFNQINSEFYSVSSTSLI